MSCSHKHRFDENSHGKELARSHSDQQNVDSAGLQSFRRRKQIGDFFQPAFVPAELASDAKVDVIATAWANRPRLHGQPATTPGDDRIVWFENRGDDQWVVHSLQSKFPGASQVITADFNGDGRSDIVATCDGAWANRKQVFKSEIRWWRNGRALDRSADVVPSGRASA